MRTLLSLILLCLATAATAQTGPGDTRLRALQTADADRGFEAVGRLNMGESGFCTATLIAPDRVLTAAHCLFEPGSGRRYEPGELRFLAGWRTGRAEAIRAVTRTAVWPGFDFAAGADLTNVPADIALLALDRPVRTPSIQPFTVALDSVATGARVSVISYGRDRAEAPSIQRACHVLDRRPPGILVLSCAIDFGSSGAPVFVTGADGAVIVSMISALGHSRAQPNARPISLGMQLGTRVQTLMRALDQGGVGGDARQPQGARGSARFLRPPAP